jgi:hypothetical protein
MLRAPALLYERPAFMGEFFIKQGSLKIEFNSNREKKRGREDPRKTGIEKRQSDASLRQACLSSQLGTQPLSIEVQCCTGAQIFAAYVTVSYRSASV